MRETIHTIINEAETFYGKLFDILLMASILLSVFAIILESVNSINARFGYELRVIEWVFTIVFTIEYLFRVFSIKKPHHYIFSFFGVVDLLSILPSYLGLFIEESHFLMVVRSLRLLRIFRVLKLARYMGEADILIEALRASRFKITVFLGFIFIITTIIGSVMFVVEGPQNGFTSIPRGIYWAIVTLTTVGYGDITPQTPFGQGLSSIIMILGYGVLAVPTGIVSAELSRARPYDVTAEACPVCGRVGHDSDAVFCKHCGAQL